MDKRIIFLHLMDYHYCESLHYYNTQNDYKTLQNKITKNSFESVKVNLESEIKLININ